MSIYRKVLLCITLCCAMCGVAFAECSLPDGVVVPCAEPELSKPPTITTTVTGSANGAAEQMVLIVGTVERELAGFAESSPLKEMGVKILVMLFTIQVVWLLVKGIATGRMLDQFLGDILPLCVASVCALYFMGVEGSTTIGSAVVGFTNAVGDKVAQNFSSNSVAGLVRESVISAGYIVLNIFKMPMAAGSMSIMNLLTGGVVILLISAMFKVITIAIVFCILAVALGTFIATVILSQVSVYIALIFLPIFVPLMIFKPTSSMFDGWLSFLISSALAKIIGALILQITDKIFKAMVATSKTLPPMGSMEAQAVTFTIDIVSYLMLILMAFICLLMVTRIESIARALGGSVVSGFKGFAGEAGFKGALGGMDMKSSLGMGGKPTGGLGGGTNATSALTAAMPNMLKPISNAVGNAYSSSQGKKFAESESAFQNQKDSFIGPHKQGQEPGKTNRHDASKMSTATAKSYTAALEKINASRAPDVSQGKQRNLTIQPSHSTTSPKHADNQPRQGASSQSSGGSNAGNSGSAASAKFGGNSSAGGNNASGSGSGGSGTAQPRRLAPDRAASIQARKTPGKS